MVLPPMLKSQQVEIIIVGVTTLAPACESIAGVVGKETIFHLKLKIHSKVQVKVD